MSSHGDGEAHRKLLRNRACFFANQGSKQAESSSSKSSSTTPINTNEKSTGKIEKVDKTRVHVRWLLKAVLSDYSHRSIEDFGDMMSTMFTDSELAQNVGIKKTKACYLVTHGIAVHFRNMLLVQAKKSKIHVLSFDESLNDNTQRNGYHPSILG